MDPSTRSLRAAIYSRVSTVDRGQDPVNQINALRDLAARNGMTVVAEFTDRETGTGRRRRSEFERMLLDAEARTFDVLLIWAIDRLSREGTLKTLLLLDRLAKAGVKVRSLSEPWLDPASPTYELLLPIFAWIARQESLRISERVRAGLATAVAKGRKLGRIPKHGEKAGEILKQILQFRMEGKSLRDIGKIVGLSRSRISQIANAAQTPVKPLPKPQPNLASPGFYF
jgi:DNA invertase Pin-like site-specific DNA recombinase